MLGSLFYRTLYDGYRLVCKFSAVSGPPLHFRPHHLPRTYGWF